MMPSHIPTKPPGAYRVLHTADWHLGKMLGEHSREEEHRLFLEFLLAAVREHSVDALLIAGDVFDSANPPQRAVAQYYDFLSALFRQGGCSVIIVAGNHDSPGHLEAPRQVLKALGAHVVGSLPQSAEEALVPLPGAGSPQLVVAAVPFLRDRDLRTGQSGQSAADIQRELVEGIKRRYQEVAAAAKPWTDRGVPLLATGHLTVVGSRLSDSEREIHVGGLGAIGADSFPEVFDYVALGHLHRPQAAGGRDTVRYAGSPIPLSFSEAGDRKEVRVVDFTAGRGASHAPLEIPPARALAQICTRRQMLEADLGGFRAPPGELPAWVEVVIEDPIAGENLYDRVRELTNAKGYEVIRVSGKRTEVPSGMSVAGPSDAGDIADFLAEPARVFERRLEAEPALTEEERAGLRTAFLELLSLHAELERQSEPETTEKGASAGEP